MSAAKKSYPNGRCCVFQPFDGGEFDRRYDDILAPATENAGMEPYRVDRDAGASIPVETLHHEIRSAGICLADITTRNANVMYELGYAIAAGKDVVIISGPSHEKFPFDIQHRNVIKYSAGSISDFRKLEEQITARLNAILEKQFKTSEIVAASPVKSSDGLQPHEMTALALLMANSDSLDDSVSAAALKQEMQQAGYNEIGTRLSLARLVKLGFCESLWGQEGFNEAHVLYRLTESGETWLLDNQTKLQLRVTESDRQRRASEASVDQGITDDDVPF